MRDHRPKPFDFRETPNGDSLHRIVRHFEERGIVVGQVECLNKLFIEHNMNKSKEAAKYTKAPKPPKLNLTVKCEHCGDEVKYSRQQWPEGWTQCGVSKYGDKYLKSKIAFWCPKHIGHEFLEASQVPNNALCDGDK
jgi:hypothetical protein